MIVPRGRTLLLVCVAATRSLAAEDKPLVAGRDVDRPTRIHYVAPDQSIAQRLRIRSLILIEVLVDARGRPTHGTMLRGQPELDGAALNALKAWQYEPTIVDGVARPVVLIEGVEFLYAPFELPELYANLAKDRSYASDTRVYAIWRLQHFLPKSRKLVIKTLQKLRVDEDPRVANAAATALPASSPDD